MARDKFEAVDTIGAFAGLPTKLKRQIAGLAGVQGVGKGSTLFREGETAHFVYAILDGHVALVSGDGGSDTIADFMGPGEIVLIPPALLDLPYMASAKATTDVLVLLIPAATFRSLVKTEVAIAEAVAFVLARHWRLLIGQLKQVKTRDAGARLAQFFVDKAETAAGATHITLATSKGQIAAHLGITPETLSRALKRLRHVGVRTQGSRVEIASIEGLTAFARSAAPTAGARAHHQTASRPHRGYKDPV